MDRRRILLIAAALVAVFGVVLVFLYVQSADKRAEDKFATSEVLVATGQIFQGESVADANAAGKISLQPVAEGQTLPGALTSVDSINGLVALTTLYPGEQIIPAKFGSTAEASSTLQIPEGRIAISVNLTDPARVAGFVNPGSEVAIFLNGDSPEGEGSFTRVVLSKITVIGVGSTTPVTTTTTEGTNGTQTVEALPRTLLTLAVTQNEAERILYAEQVGELALGLLGDDSRVRPGPGVTFDNLFAGR